jgi:hypothetical protein
MRNKKTHGSIKVAGLRPQSVAQVLGEDRTLTVTSGQFSDEFPAYGVHLYRITANPAVNSKGTLD